MKAAARPRDPRAVGKLLVIDDLGISHRRRAELPLLVRAVVDSGLYWLAFYPDLFNGALKYLGMDFQLHSAIPEFGVVSLFAGLFVDSLVDFAVTKLPYVKDWLPQMPAPLPKAASVGEVHAQ